MNDLVKGLVLKEAMMGELLSLPRDQLGKAIRRIQTEAEARSAFKLGQLVRTCNSPGISLVGGLSELPHDHNDPKQHSNTRVVGWNSFGEIEVATAYGSNPHCCEWPHSENKMIPCEDTDWATQSPRKRGEKVSYVWELRGFWEADKHVGEVVPAILVVPHIKEGDWIVQYRKPADKELWITRVINEEQMLPPLPDNEYPASDE